MAGIDFNKLRKESTTVLEGDFPVVIVKAEAGQSSNGKPMIKTQLKIEAGPYAGRIIYNNFTISAESQIALKMLFEALEVLGLGEAYFATNPELEQISSSLLGRRATVALEARVWNGVPRENVKTWKPAEGGAAGLGVGMGVVGGLSGMSASALPTMPAAIAASIPVALLTPNVTPSSAPPVMPSDGPDPF